MKWPNKLLVSYEYSWLEWHSCVNLTNVGFFNSQEKKFETTCTISHYNGPWNSVFWTFPNFPHPNDWLFSLLVPLDRISVSWTPTRPDWIGLKLREELLFFSRLEFLEPFLICSWFRNSTPNTKDPSKEVIRSFFFLVLLVSLIKININMQSQRAVIDCRGAFTRNSSTLWCEFTCFFFRLPPFFSSLMSFSTRVLWEAAE